MKCVQPATDRAASKASSKTNKILLKSGLDAQGWGACTIGVKGELGDDRASESKQ